MDEEYEIDYDDDDLDYDEDDLDYDEDELDDEDEYRGDDKTVCVSPSSLQMIRNCSYSYYYYKVKRLPGREFREKRPGIWLTPAERGNLVHEVMQSFYSGIAKKPLAEIPDSVTEKDIIAVFDKYRDMIPAVSTAVRKREEEQLKRKCLAFIDRDLKRIHNQPKDKVYIPLITELEIQDDFQTYDIEGEFADEPTLHIKPTGSRVDRIDYYKDDEQIIHCRIVDYKTGRLKGRDPDKQRIEAMEKSCQHAIYSRAICEYQKDENGKDKQTVVVDEFVYEYLLDDEPKSVVLTGEDMKSLCDYMQMSNIYHTLMTGEPYRYGVNRDCRYCNYRDICMQQYQ